MSAMISLNVAKQHLDLLREILMALARRSLADKAAIKEEGAAHIIKKLEHEVRTLIHIITFDVELDIAALGFGQNIFKDVNHHQQLLTAVF